MQLRISNEQDLNDERILVCANADNSIRWTQGERLNDLFERRCDELGDAEAVVTDAATYSFRDLDDRANQTAHYLLGRGLKSGDRIGLVFDKTFDTYVALLAVLKINAAYVPLDAGFPNDRIAFICGDAGVKTILSLSIFGAKLDAIGLPKIFLDAAAAEIDREPTARPTDAERRAPLDQLAFLIYTSGTSGTPKGVAIEHASICNFVRVAAEVYGMRPGDRCYQGMTIAFDFSVEELWVPLLAGAALVPGKPGTSLVGSDLADYLEAKRVTVMCCVPTLLGTIERDLPDLRILLVSGEACPQNLVTRWQKPGRIMLNAYGPTEATVTCTLTELYPNKPVTIGGPLPTYSIVILAEDKDEALARGAMGEIAVAGVGLAAGYLNRADLTQKKFILDFVHIANNPSGRIYRTGDLGRINDNGEVEFHGRIDTQVKLRGYRIELAEIEAVLEEMPQISQAVVNVYESEPGAPELVAYYTRKHGLQEPPASEVAEKLRKRLPPYMVPAYLERLDNIPMTTSHKADRKALPPPQGQRLAAGSGNFVAARTPTEETLVQALGEVMKIDRISVADNFFQDLGAHSLLMARFAAAIRARLGVPAVSMRDIYLNPTIEKLAQRLAEMPEEAPPQPRSEPSRIPTNLEYYGCGFLQLLTYVGGGALGIWLGVIALEWVYAGGAGLGELYLRALAVTAAGFVVLTAAPILLKWLLIGRWKEETFPIWSLRYFRFWLVKTLVQNNPMAAFIGTPLYNVYLRLLGAKIGRGAVISARIVPPCTDLISIGDNAVLRTGCVMLGYKAQSNYIHTGPVSIGNNASVGEGTVLDIRSAMEDDTQLGHASSLQAGQRVPRGKHYHGSPAQETLANYFAVEGRRCSPLRRAAFSLYLLTALLAFAPLAFVLARVVYAYLHDFTGAMHLDDAASWPILTAQLMLASLVIYFVSVPLGLGFIYLAPRFLQLFLRKDRTYVLFGFHDIVYRSIKAITNSRFYSFLLGDSALVVTYLRLVGYRLENVIQSGSNFGQTQAHDNPFLCEIGSGTMVSDGLTMINATTSSTSFVLRDVRIGAHNYFGNNVFYPSTGRTGENCLFATKAMVPVDGPIRENIGLLGSPSFEIPRAVERDKNVALAVSDEVRAQQLRAKLHHNLITMLFYLLRNWVFVFVVLSSSFLAVRFFPNYHVAGALVAAALVSLFGIAWFCFIERAGLGFGRLTPKVVSIYDEYFWRHERYWKLCPPPMIRLFKGTPFKNVISRLLGMKVGRKVFDDGGLFCDKSLIEIGDYTNLNEGSLMQGHSLEEGVFKSDYIRIGSGCTLGVGAFIHYGITMGDNAALDPDSFLMKGEVVAADATWRGNPARAIG